MTRIADAAGGFATLQRLVRALVRQLRRVAIAAAVAVIPIALLLRRGGFNAEDAVATVLLLAPSAVVLFFAQGLAELVAIPDRLRRLPSEGRDTLEEVARLGQTRRGRLRRAPIVLWRLRGPIGSLRDVAGIALPLRVLTPPFLGAAALAAAVCLLLVPAGVIALVMLAVG